MNQSNPICHLCIFWRMLWLIVTFLVLLSPVSAHAAEAADGNRRVSGKVVDAAGEPIIGANVVLVGGGSK